MREREYRLDIIRLLSTFLVVVIHISNYYCRYLPKVRTSSFVGASVFNSIARISVPLFFMISGALMLGRDINVKKLMGRIGHFVFVLVVWTLVYVIFDIKYMGYTFAKEQYITLIFDNLKPHLWFMYVIIGLYMVLPFARILIKNMDRTLRRYFMVLWLVFCGGSLLLRIILEWFEIKTTLSYEIPIVQGTYYLGYFMAGRIIYERLQECNLPRKIWSLAIFVAATSVTVLGTISYSFRDKKFYNVFLSYRNLPIMLAAISVFVFILSLPQIKSERLKKVLAFLAPRLFGIYLIHIIFFDILIKSVDMLKINSFIGIPLSSLGIMLVSFVAVFVISLIPGVRKIIE